MRIIGICGSIRENSNTFRALQLVIKKIQEHGIDCELVDLRDYKLPFCDGTGNYPSHPDYQRFLDKIKRSNGIILASPEYHGGMSGVLKNALDLVNADQVEGKIFALISVMGGLSSSGAIDSMRMVLRQLHGWVIPRQLIVPNADLAFDQFGEFIDQSLVKRSHQMIDQFLDAVQKFKN